MSTLVAIAYPDPQRAGEVKNALARLEVEHLIDVEDSAWVERRADGKIKLHQTQNLTANGAVGGLLWGTVIGLLFMNPLLGGVIGAGAGALSGSLSDFGINDDFMKQLAASLTPGSSAIFVLIRRVTEDKVLPEMARFGGQIIKSSLSKAEEERLQRALQPTPD